MLKFAPLLAAYIFGQALCYPGYGNYYYSAPLSDQSYYSSMSDIDWSKRGSNDWISPAYGYSSMADYDWGWKKRADVAPAASAEEEDDDGADVKRSGSSYDSSDMTPAKRKYYGRSSFFKKYDPSYWQRYYLPYKPSYSRKASLSVDQPSAVTSRFVPASSASDDDEASKTSSSSYSSYSSPLKDNRFAYRSMADMDWGWKKRKRSSMDKRHIGSISNKSSLRGKPRKML